MPRFSLGALLLALLAPPLAAQGTTAILDGILRAEDRRARVPGDVVLLENALRHPDALVRGRAARALGRLERPRHLPALFPLLADPAPGVRGHAAEAVAQAAQGFRGDSTLAARGPLWPALLDTLGGRATHEEDPGIRGMLALSLGRLPYLAPGEITEARRRVTALLLGAEANPLGAEAAARGWAMLARGTARRLPLSEGELAPVRRLALEGQSPVRRALVGALAAAGARDSATMVAALLSTDAELRRLALTGPLPPGIAGGRPDLLEAALHDPVPFVRVEGLRAWSRAGGAAACPLLARAGEDSVQAVRLVAIDLLGGCVRDSAAARALVTPGRDWHERAHALVSLARAFPGQARPLLAGAAAAEPWQLRMYSARAAAQLRDTSALVRLAGDRDANVREAALTGLRETAGHAADSLYLRALGAADGQLVLTAADALKGTPAHDAAALALAASLTRLTATRSETSRDPRLALLARLRELGSPREAAALRPLLRDFDPVVAESAAVLLAAWTGKSRAAAPVPFDPPPVRWVDAEALRGRRLRFTMADSSVFEVELLVDEAPLTVAAVVRLARAGWYAGRTFHRVVPNFVLQGGSPGANEYAGWSRFLRDELGPLSHARGTLGISTRGRDTGDGQLFLNLVDNPRLDYEYTVWGRVVSGLEVLDRIAEGDVILRVEIRPR